MIHSIGLTGGIGSGKSTIAGILKQLGYPVYLADPEASRLINRSVEIRNDLTSLFGADLYTPPRNARQKIISGYHLQKSTSPEPGERDRSPPGVIRDFSTLAGTAEQSFGLLRIGYSF